MEVSYNEAEQSHDNDIDANVHDINTANGEEQEDADNANENNVENGGNEAMDGNDNDNDSSEPKDPVKIEVKNNDIGRDLFLGDNNTVTNNNDIGRDFISGDGNTINNINLDDNIRPRPFTFADIIFDVEEIAKHHIEVLLDENFLIINCSHDGIAESIRQAIAQNDKLNAFKKQQIIFDTHTKDKPDITHLIQNCRKKDLNGNNDKLLLFVDDNNIDNPLLLRLLSKKGTKAREDIIDKLRDDMCIAYITYHENKDFLEYSSFDFQTVDAFGIYIKNYDISMSTKDIILRDQNDGYWGEGEKALLNDLDKIINESNVEQIIINKRKEGIKGIEDFVRIFQDENSPLGKYVLFIASLFSELSLDVFDSYLKALIIGQSKVLIGKKKWALLTLWEANSDTILHQCGLQTYFKDNQNQYFIDFKNTKEAINCKKALLRSMTFFTNQQARLFIEKQALFSQGSPRELHDQIHPVIADLSTSFKNYFGNEILKNWLLEFEPQRKTLVKLKKDFERTKADRKAVSNKIKEFQDMKAIENKEEELRFLKRSSAIDFQQLHQDWLEELQMVKFLFHRQEGLPEGASVTSILNQLYDLDNKFYRRLVDINNEYVPTHYHLDSNIRLFVNLLTTIYEHGRDKTAQIIKDFFEDRFRFVHQHYVLFDILTKFYIKNEDYISLEFYWQCIEHNNKSIHESAMDALCELFLEQPYEIQKSFIQIKQWLSNSPSEDKNVQIIIIFFRVFKELQLKERKIETEPKDSHTFKMLFESNEPKPNAKCLQFIFEGMLQLYDIKNDNTVFYKTYGNTLNEYISMENRNSHLPIDTIKESIVTLIFHWYGIVDHAGHEGKQLLLDTILKKTTSAQLRSIIKHLENYRLLFNKRLSKINDRKEKDKLIAKRATLVELTNSLKL
ncbi:hypothetical protein [uncultured Psychroserpens sp.]|uniref:hypothetical protein n=1 Tax=uncultured Psychroserpens sp. TaxID=255436 RepID=UPI0026086606|nr:hypothetical protein [uncultured Psychroserpens sp.]